MNLRVVAVLIGVHELRLVARLVVRFLFSVVLLPLHWSVGTSRLQVRMAASIYAIMIIHIRGLLCPSAARLPRSSMEGRLGRGGDPQPQPDVLQRLEDAV